MKKVLVTLLLSLPMIAAASTCDEISASITEKIKNNGVPESLFQLKLIPATQEQQQIEGKIVGSCDSGKQNIVYIRSGAITTESKAEASTSAPAENAPAMMEQAEPIITAPVESKIPETTAPIAPESEMTAPVEPKTTPTTAPETVTE